MGLRIPTGRRQTSWLFISVVAREFELGTIQNKSSKRSGRDFNSGLRDYKSSALTARPHCLLLLRLMICCFFDVGRYYFQSLTMHVFKAPCKRTQHCWMLHGASVCTPCCMLLDVVACCCAKFENGQTFQPTTPNISFVA